MANWEGDFQSQELFLHRTTAPKHSFSPAVLRDTVPFPTEQHFQPHEGFPFYLKPKLLFLQYCPAIIMWMGMPRLYYLPCQGLCAWTVTQVGTDHHLLCTSGLVARLKAES